MEMDVPTFISGMPLNELLGIEVTDADDGWASGRIDYREEICFRLGDQHAVHGGVTFALADTVGAAAVMSLYEDLKPAFTLDMRIDYLETGQTDLRAEAEVRRYSAAGGVVDATVEDADGTPVAVARGRFRAE